MYYREMVPDQLFFRCIMCLLCAAWSEELLLRNGDGISKADKTDTHSLVNTVDKLSQKGDEVFRVANYYQSGMVLQRGYPGIIWGYGEPKQNVSVKIGENVTVSGFINDSGIWSVTFPAMDAGGPYNIYVVSVSKKREEKIILRSVLFGDVWLCSGQSNMAFPVYQMFNGSNELIKSSQFNEIRFMKIRPSESNSPLYEPDIAQDWSAPNVITLREFSAVCWATARRMYEQIRVPIGLIGSYYGGTPIRSWSPPEVIEQCNHTSVPWTPNRIDLSEAPGNNSVLWNAMISPLTPLNLAGVLWYQGENDSFLNRQDAYLCYFPAMVEEWRRKFRRNDLPFGFVQIGDQNQETEDGGTALVRWHQTADFGYAPNRILKNVFMAVAMDLPDPKSPYGSIHPRHKEDIAQRLFAGAMSIAYNIEKPYLGPFPNWTLLYNELVIFVEYDRNITFVGGYSYNFEVCCDATSTDLEGWKDCKNWEQVRASVGGPLNKVTVMAGSCGIEAQFIRYAWALTPCDYKNCTIYATDDRGDERGLPGPPFVLPVNWRSALPFTGTVL